MLRRVQQENRPATADEQQVLARWSGFGAIPQVFDEHRPEHAPVREQLAALTSPAAPVPVGEPYPSVAAADIGIRRVLHEYWALRRTAAGERMLQYARTIRPDAAALKAAAGKVPGWYAQDQDRPGPDELTAALAACAQAGQVLLDNLDREHHRAPQFRGHLETFIDLVRQAAGRMAATAAAGGFPGQPAPRPAVAPDGPAHEASAGGEPTPTISSPAATSTPRPPPPTRTRPGRPRKDQAQ